MQAAPTDKKIGVCTLHCDHAVATALVTTWLRDLQLPWPGDFTITVVVSDDGHPVADARAVIRQPTVRIQAGPPADTVHIEWEVAAAVAVVDPNRSDAQLWLSPAALEKFESAERSFLLVMLVFLMRRQGWYHVHGATLVDPRGRGWLIAGDSHCGKSTTTALLATRGWQVGTDDIGFLSDREGRIVSTAARSPISLRKGGLELLGAKGGIEQSRRNKTGFWPDELGSTWTQDVMPELIMFPTLGERTGIVPAPARAALSEIVKWSLWVLFEPAFAQEHLDVLGRLARQSRCFNLTLGPDLFDHPDMLENLVP